MSALETLLGSTLLGKKGGVTTSTALKGKKAVGLYFSAHWCGPCRSFTPQLAKAYEGLVAKGKELEIVFVSSDRDEKAFTDYFGEQPWLALPYSARDMKATLSKKYKVSGIPSLVILDGETGELITKDGRSAVMEDTDGSDFPWKPPTLWDALGEEVLNGDGDTVEIADLRGEGKVLGIYFSAHWCPPCRTFTPELISTYNKLKAAGKDFEIIFASSDKTPKDFQSYFGTMPWLAIPQGDKRKEKLSKLFEVEGIPSFVMIDAATGKTINDSARGSVGGDPEGADFPWYPKPVNDLASPDGINEETSLCVMMDGCDAGARAAALAVLIPIAKASQAAESEMKFFIANSAEGAVPQIRKMANLGAATTTPQLLLVDIPDNGGYFVGPATEVTADTIAAFLDSYKAGTLERKQLG